MNDADLFTQRYGGLSFDHAEDLFSLLRAGRFFSVTRYPGTQPCHQLAQIYRDRAGMLDHYHHQRDSELWSAFTALARSLSESPDEPCRLWLFRGGTACFSVFEAADSRIAGCLKTDGVSEPKSE